MGIEDNPTSQTPCNQQSVLYSHSFLQNISFSSFYKKKKLCFLWSWITPHLLEVMDKSRCLESKNWQIQTFPNLIKLLKIKIWNEKYRCLKSKFSWPYTSTVLFSPFCVFLFLKPERERGDMAIEDTHPHSFPARPLSFFPYCSNRNFLISYWFQFIVVNSSNLGSVR